MGPVLHQPRRFQKLHVHQVSVPFSMGPVLHLCIGGRGAYNAPSFSPLLDGASVASRRRPPAVRRNYPVSVPFSMGPVLHLRLFPLAVPPAVSFSPLLDGASVASTQQGNAVAAGTVFQSPSRWGQCCIKKRPSPRLTPSRVSVPFSMGPVLHREGPRPCSIRSCVSVPFSMGPVLHLRSRNDMEAWKYCFSPLLDGASVASHLDRCTE